MSGFFLRALEYAAAVDVVVAGVAIINHWQTSACIGAVVVGAVYLATRKS